MSTTHSTAKKQRQQQRGPLESGSSVEKLLAQSPNYVEGCELYPKAMRETINEFPEGAVLTERDPGVTAEAERCHRASVERQRQRSATNPEEVLCFYPGASRTTAATSKRANHA